jgi:hypothetical protein
VTPLTWNSELEDEGTARFKPILTFFDSPAIYLLGVIIDAVEKEVIA